VHFEHNFASRDAISVGRFWPVEDRGYRLDEQPLAVDREGLCPALADRFLENPKLSGRGFGPVNRTIPPLCRLVAAERPGSHRPLASTACLEAKEVSFPVLQLDHDVILPPIQIASFAVCRILSCDRRAPLNAVPAS
jgi:hypothetical protein